MFEGFTLDRGDAVLRVRHGGSGPPVLLLHGRPRTHAMLEDYRAGLGIDRQHDEADRAAGRRIGCPLLFLGAKRDDLEDLYGDPLAIWRDWAGDLLLGQSVDCGHHIAEEAPDELAKFFA